MKHALESYSTIIFDCDGVVLDSNKIKTQAFYEATCEFGSDVAEQFVEYHKANGGISRFKKFEHFASSILNSKPENKSTLIAMLIDRYSRLVSDNLLTCTIESSIHTIRSITERSKWLIVSGSAQNELRWLFRTRDIDTLFDSGIFGSPESKEEIFAREINAGNIVEPVLFIGDSKYDYLAAKQFNMDFVFISQWTEFSEWESFCFLNNIPNYHSLLDLMKP